MTGIRLDNIRYDSQGLVPAIVQDAISKDVLMLAYMNNESLEKTAATGTTWFWSRSRQELWNKGATSGHTQRVVSLRYDCDADTLLVLVEQTGPACHTGSYTCFGGEIPVAGADSAETGESAAVPASSDRFGILSRLESVIASREAERPEGAYTTYLFEKGIDKILKKVGEETAEVIIAAKNRDHDELRYETSDLIFHLMVLLRESKLPLDDVMAELERRHMSKSK
ncbi:bifunctional phosphoribosyl-AMP cyclohydrolase/phosphoribosyl-ATP diphosphatase HisIE [Paenibacillus chitinolyticus]|uniref:Histidine biosynthesis bifunctional protein HisIE n=1 Tax=Paenibacillus chitinolyticus TaxID=79263 RepID=A0A410WR03_9BACL|nr:bifunctional phosphoribosyl-AMP cyclohydrolase/phosphoribosyl-ATP diphosphatase HisIE [Paenibacillus chitinolyticus]MCY9591617.1 bifunctional phosphoribosyl-AMP cyclohydrolase/phosphoribosyl-ATP diphosphatase HisIE [Paenibacillus chitinolyticus]MCY9594550.1 bifunctional phosphoribosyl-AMP cyclohydrolase/phosphoribosyl-ATP diphosphatase HisIE [Paenibacillus chitinolyticus]QAV16795.1 bifunctional phosphoribosyl-AMP cyclohydrolase/phosphoribosyl-ATP diphosphatase HisIE [Paenibacillus chitinolyti